MSPTKQMDFTSSLPLLPDFSCKHLRILSGLYGMLKPFDLISPYSLEMKTPLNLPENKSLSAYWKKRVSDELEREEALSEKNTIILNLSSAEYSKAVSEKLTGRKIISFQFKELKTDKLTTVGMYAKTARGKMIKKIIRNRTTDPETLKSGETAGYSYNAKFSSDSNWVFIREQA